MRDELANGNLKQLQARFANRSAVIGIVGLGYKVLKCALKLTGGSSGGRFGARGSSRMLGALDWCTTCDSGC
jgi:hypothetical protein